MMKPLLLFCVAIGWMAVQPASTARTLYDFNEVSQMADFNSTGGTTWSWGANAGIGSTGGVAANNGGGASTLVLKNGFAGDVSFTLSISFQWVTAVSGAGHGAFIGFGPSATYAPFYGGGGSSPSVEQNQVYFGIGRVAAGDTIRIVGNSVAGGVSENFQGPSEQNVTLTSGEWYQLSGDVTYSSEEKRYTVAVTLYSFGGEGGSPMAISTHTFTTPESQDMSALAGDEVHAFFGTAANSIYRGVSAIDNFSVPAPIPEPATLGLLGAGVVLFGSARWLRRRKR
ncbi:MAG TPA: PEP-CTERM sorting domain-containing protein [Chthoniobacteraceae bacterium]|nr:PEP-CTERM sorting domain-containing protein [Chthoniobacteraceae bacterium]